MKHTVDAFVNALQHSKHRSAKDVGHSIAVAAAADGMTYQDAYCLFHHVIDSLNDAEKSLFMSSLASDSRVIHSEHLVKSKY